MHIQESDEAWISSQITNERLLSWCFDSVYPPITVDVSDAIPVPSMNARFCYVISVPESDSAPHFLNGRKTVWFRHE